MLNDDDDDVGNNHATSVHCQTLKLPADHGCGIGLTRNGKLLLQNQSFSLFLDFYFFQKTVENLEKIQIFV